MKLPRRKFLKFAASATVLPAMARIASALNYPTRPVHVIVGFPAATTPDIVARLLGQWLATRLGQPFVIANHPGAGSSIAAQEIVNARADAHMLFMATTSNTINATIYPNLTFNFARDIAPVAIVNGALFVMVINPALPPKTVPEFIAYAKVNPCRINMASPGVGTTAHLCYELLKMMTGVDLVHAPYRAARLRQAASAPGPADERQAGRAASPNEV